MICVDSLASKFRSPDLSPYISSPQISNGYNVFFHSQDKTAILQKNDNKYQINWRHCDVMHLFTKN